MAVERLPSFGSVFGIPRGGLAFSKALVAYKTQGPPLIADDVLTTGASMEDMRGRLLGALGVVVFARGKCPDWIVPLFQMDAKEKEVVSHEPRS